MKYLKLFENFDGEDPKWILMSALDPIEVDEISFDERFKDTSMFQMFGLNDIPSDDKLNHLKSWLGKEGYYSIIHVHKNYNNNRIIVTDKPIKEACIDCLNTNYSGMEAVDSKDYPDSVLYRSRGISGIKNIFFHDKRFNTIYIRYDLIWLFLENYFGISRQLIEGILKNWMSETYNVNGIKTWSPQSKI
jgi:hypothetical protein